MAGFGSGRYGGGPTAESAVRLDIDSMMHWGAMRPGFHLGGEMRLHQLYGDDIDVKFESHAVDPWNSWLCLRYSMTDYCSGEAGSGLGEGGLRALLLHDLAGEVVGAIPSGLILVGRIVAAPMHLHTDAALLKM